jgi:hypothetical protein
MAPAERSRSTGILVAFHIAATVRRGRERAHLVVPPLDRRSTSRRTSMATLTEKKRDHLKESEFGLPEEHKYPMPDESHARNAKARASQQAKAGNLTPAEKKKIDKKADQILDK